MYWISDPEARHGFYKALGFEFRRDLPIVRGSIVSPGRGPRHARVSTAER